MIGNHDPRGKSPSENAQTDGHHDETHEKDGLQRNDAAGALAAGDGSPVAKEMKEQIRLS